MRNFANIILFISLGISSTAQKLEFTNLRLGVTPSSLANVYSGIQFSLDKKIRPQINFTTELAYIFSTPARGKGFRIRPGIERMLLRGENAALTGGLHLNYRLTGEYRNIISPSTNGQSEKIYYNQFRWRSYFGTNLSMNLMFKVTPRWIWEFGGGLGIADYSFYEKRPLNDRDRFEDRQGELFITIDENISPFGIFYLHLNFSYTLSI